MTEVTNKPTVWGEVIPRLKNFHTLANVIYFFLHKFTIYPFLILIHIFQCQTHLSMKSPFFRSSLCLHCDIGYSGQVYLFCIVNLDTSAGSALSLMNPMVTCQYQSCILGTNGDFSAKEKSWL